jgi:putative phosphoribosyl transferase
MTFSDRTDAGQKLSRELRRYSGRQDAIVLGIPRGGVLVAFEIAGALNLPMDIFLSRKLAVPGHEELAFGAISVGEERFLDRHIVQAMEITPEQIESITQETRRKLDECAQIYWAGRTPRELTGQRVILVDDGIATGASIYAAVQALRPMNPKEIVIAVPVAPATTVNWLRGVVEDIAVLYAPGDFHAVGQFYREFSQVSDREVMSLLQRAQQIEARRETDVENHSNRPRWTAGNDQEIRIGAGDATLEGILNVPENAQGIVLFAHGSGSSRHSPRNRFVARELQARRLATLLFDLLTSEEEIVDRKTAELRFNIPPLAKRLIEVTRWVAQNPQTRNLTIGYFGASTGAAVALVAAARLPGIVAAVVSRGGRSDLAGEELASVRAATLLIAGERDEAIIQMNHKALDLLGCEDKDMVLVPGATHLFEESGALEQVSTAAAEWLVRYLIHGKSA